MSPRPIRTVPVYVRTANRARGLYPERAEALQEIVERAPSVTELLLRGIFGTIADREAAEIATTYADEIGRAIEEELFAGVLFEVGVYLDRDTNTYGTHRIRLVRAGANAQDSLERDFYIIHTQGATYRESPDPSKYRYDNSQSFLIFVSKDENGDGYSSEKITNPQMLRNVAASKVIEGAGIEARRIEESERIIRKYRTKISDARQAEEESFTSSQIENLAAARINLENKMLEANALLQKAREERKRATFFNDISSSLAILGAGLKFGGSLVGNLPVEGETLEGYQYTPTLDLEFNFDPNLDPEPFLRERIRNFEIEAVEIENIIG